MDKTLQKAHELKQAIDELPEIQYFYNVKSLFENNQEIKDLENEIKQLEKDNNQEELNKVVIKYHSHPLYINYQAAYEEAYKIMKVVGNIIRIEK